MKKDRGNLSKATLTLYIVTYLLIHGQTIGPRLIKFGLQEADALVHIGTRIASIAALFSM